MGPQAVHSPRTYSSPLPRWSRRGRSANISAANRSITSRTRSISPSSIPTTATQLKTTVSTTTDRPNQVLLGLCASVALTVALAAGYLDHRAGAHPASAVLRAGTAFAGTFGLEILILTVLGVA